MSKVVQAPESPQIVHAASEADVITVPEMQRRLQIRAQDAYNMVATPGFPVINITGGERGNRVIWGDVLNWLRQKHHSA